MDIDSYHISLLFSKCLIVPSQSKDVYFKGSPDIIMTEVLNLSDVKGYPEAAPVGLGGLSMAFPSSSVQTLGLPQQQQLAFSAFSAFSVSRGGF